MKLRSLHSSTQTKATVRIRKIVYAAMCLTLAYALPFLTFGVQQAGQIFCLMHIPVFLCGFLCGWQWGLAVGVAAPLLRNLTLGMPPFPTAGFMMAELAVYGLLAGLLFRLLPRKKIFLWFALAISMLGGRAVNGVLKTLYYLANPGKYSFMLFLTESFVTALPGILIALAAVPTLVLALYKAGLQPEDRLYPKM